MKFRVIGSSVACVFAAGILSLAFRPANAQNDAPAGTAQCQGCSWTERPRRGVPMGTRI